MLPVIKSFANVQMSLLNKLDALIISDYGLGVADPNQMEIYFAEADAFRSSSFSGFASASSVIRDATAATPNEPEVESLLGKILDNSLLLQAGDDLLQNLGMKALLITRGKNGMALFTSDAAPAMIPIFGSTDIVDVTGAGDTVISTFALAVSSGASFYDAARLANCAAGITVMKRGAATVSIEELNEAIRVASMHL